MKETQIYPFGKGVVSLKSSASTKMDDGKLTLSHCIRSSLNAFRNKTFVYIYKIRSETVVKKKKIVESYILCCVKDTRRAVCAYSSWRCPSAGGCQYLNKAQRRDCEATELTNPNMTHCRVAAASLRFVIILSLARYLNFFFFLVVAVVVSFFLNQPWTRTRLDKTCQKRGRDVCRS